MESSIHPDLIQILACPETKQTLRLADDKFISELNARIMARAATNHGGATIEKEIDGALLRADGKRAYLIRESIPVMLVEESVDL